MTESRTQHRGSRRPISSADSMYDLMKARSDMASRAMEMNGFSIEIINGQRIPTNMRLDPKPILEARWNEIFIGKLPRDMFEDQLLPFISRPSPVYNIRYMLDFSHTNRGYCYVKYANTEEAARAIKYLDGLIIAAGRLPIGAKISFDNRSLFFSNLPLRCSAGKLQEVLERAEVKGIVSVQMRGQPTGQSHQAFRLGARPPKFPGESHLMPINTISSNNSSCSALVTFSTHDAATRARRLLLPGDVELFGRRIKLDWAKSDVPEHVQEILERYMLNNPVRNYSLSLPQPKMMPDPRNRTRNESSETSANTDSSSSCTSPSSFGDINNNTTLFAHEMFQNSHQEMHNYQIPCNDCFSSTTNNGLNSNGSIYFPTWNELNMSLASDNYRAMLDSDFMNMYARLGIIDSD